MNQDLKSLVERASAVKGEPEFSEIAPAISAFLAKASAADYFTLGYKLALAAERLDKYELAFQQWMDLTRRYPNNVWFLRKACEVALKVARPWDALPLFPYVLNLLAKPPDGENLAWLPELIATMALAVCEAEHHFATDSRIRDLLQAAIHEEIDERQAPRTFVWTFLRLPTLDYGRYQKQLRFIEESVFSDRDSLAKSPRLSFFYLAACDGVARPEFATLFSLHGASLSVRELEWIFSRKANFELIPQVVDTLNTSFSGRFFLAIRRFLEANPSLSNVELRSEKQVTNRSLEQNYLEAVASSRFRPDTSSAAIHVTKRRRLAVCISGQMRGYERAFSTWQRSLLSDVEHDIYVATWQARGRKQLMSLHATRILPSAAAAAYVSASLNHGEQVVKALYPSLISMIEKTDLLEVNQLREYYGAKNVVVESEIPPEVEKFGNAGKMFYKMDQANAMVRQSGINYDAVLRIRPDKEVLSGSLNESLGSLSSKDSQADRLIFIGDEGRPMLFGGSLHVNDQVALGRPDAMNWYSNVWSLRGLCELGCVGFERTLSAHRSLAYALLAGDIRVEPLKIRWGALLDPKPFSAEDILEAIAVDAKGRMNPIDVAMMAALNEDGAFSGNEKPIKSEASVSSPNSVSNVVTEKRSSKQTNIKPSSSRPLLQKLKLTESLFQELKSAGIYLFNDARMGRIGEEFSFTSETALEESCGVLGGRHLGVMGAMSYSWSATPPELRMGRYCSVSGNASILGGRHPIETLTSSSLVYDQGFSVVQHYLRSFNAKFPAIKNIQKYGVQLGHDVWVGEGVTFSNGITIGTGAVVAAKSVVTKDVPPYAIVGGNPARLIRFRFSEHIVQELLKSEWWTLHPRQLTKFDVADPEKFLDGLAQSREREPWSPRIVDEAWLRDRLS